MQNDESEQKRKCSADSVRSLLTKFVRHPLTLHQQSRAAIRRAVGMNDFDLRVQTLPLPPRLVQYIWRANEMLADVALPEGFKGQPL